MKIRGTLAPVRLSHLVCYAAPMPAKNTDKPRAELPKVEPTQEEWERFTQAVRKVATAPQPNKTAAQKRKANTPRSLP